MKRLYTFVLLLLGLFLASPPTAKAQLTTGYYYIYSARETSYMINETASNGLTVTTSKNANAIWKVTFTTSGNTTTATMQNVRTGNYIAQPTSSGYSTSSTAYSFTISDKTLNSTTYYQISYDKVDGWYTNINENGDQGIAKWFIQTGDATSVTGNDWIFTEVGIDDTQAAKMGSLTDKGGTYRITSATSTGNAMAATYKGTVECPTAASTATTSATDFDELWTLEEDANNAGMYAVKNVATGQYIQSTSTRDEAYTLGSDAYYFRLDYNRTVNNVDYYSLWNGNGRRFNLNRKSDNTVVTWVDAGITTSDAANNGEWIFTSVSYDQTTLDANADLYTDLSGTKAIKSGVVESVVTESNDSLTYTPYVESTIAKKHVSIWTLTRTGWGYYTIQNYSTGNYVQAQSENNKQYPTAATAYSMYIRKNTTISSDTYFNIYNDNTKQESLNRQWESSKEDTSGKVVSWSSVGQGSIDNGEWTFIDVTPAASIYEEASLGSLTSTDVTVCYVQSYNKSGLLEDNGATYSQHVGGATASTTSPIYNALWIKSGNDTDGYTFQNVRTGRYIQSDFTLGTTAYSFTLVSQTSVNSTTISGYYRIEHDSGSSSQNLNIYGGLNTTGTQNATGYDGTAQNDIWTFTEMTVTNQTIFDQRADYYSAATTIEEGQIYQIYNLTRDDYLTVTGYGDGCKLYHSSVITTDYDKFSQYWKAHLEADGAYTFQNVYTGKYWNCPSQVPYIVSDESSTFYPVEHTYSVQTCLMPLWNIQQNSNAVANNWVTHAQVSGSTVVNWAVGSNEITASEWMFKTVTLTDDEIAAAQADYNSKKSLINNASTYASTLTKYFTDKACTTLNSTYASVTDDELKSAMTADNLPDELQTIAVKIKNNAWTMTHGTDNASYEKEFRIQDYEAYSNPEYMATRIGVTTFTHCEQPTGIYAKKGDMLYVFVGEDDLATDYVMKLEIVAPHESNGSQTALNTGLNVVIADCDGSIVINYHDTTPAVTNATTTANDVTETNALSANNNRTVHIEGGTVNGVFDARTPANGIGHGHTNDDYTTMTSAGLFTQTTTCLRSRNLVFYLDKDIVSTAFEADKTTYGSYKITDVLGVWDKVLDDENDMAGMNDTYINGFSTHCNNIWGVHSVSSGIYASTYGTYYGDITKEMQFQEMNSNAGILWGPAHENGHLHQGLINIIGDSEVSNNCFSNMCVWKRGYNTTRGYGANSTFDQFNGTDMKRVTAKDSNGKQYSTYTGTKEFYLDFKASDGDGGCWDRTRMYWQLYLYYEVEGHHPNFYQELFAALRADNMKREADAVNYGKDNYLKFVEKVYDVTGDDLTDFFTTYGIFMPVENYYVDDYANYYITTTQDEIDEVKAKLANGNKEARNIMFIEDRIEQADAEYIAAENGETSRAEYEDGQGVGDCGNVGQYTDFDDEANVKASDYLYSLSGTTVTIASNADGAVGYKIYNTSGTLVALYNTNTFSVSQLTDFPTGYIVYAAQADGTDVEIPNSTDTKYTLTAYYGSDDAKTLYVTSAAPTDFAPNSVFVNSDNSAPAAVKNSSNVITKGTGNSYTAAKFEISDLEDFYTPSDFTATAMTYARSNTSGWNSVCLPFAVSATDIESYFGTGAKAYTATGATTTEVTLTEISGTVAAGTPMFVQCADDATDWSISGSSIAIASSAADNTNGSLVVKGSFIQKSLGEGYYKLNSAGTAFVHTTANSNVYPFRCYLDLGSAAASRLSVRFDDATSISAAEISTDAENQDSDAWYDLQGRRIFAPEKGVYIHGGKKVIVH